MLAEALTATAAPPTRRAKPIFYVRSVVALAMIAAWAIAAASGITLWLAADGRGAGELPMLLGATKHAWVDVHAAISFLAIALTLAHLTVMRRGILAYVRLLLTGQRNPVARSARRPKTIVYVRAIVVVAMVSLVPIVLASGIVPWLATDGQGSGRQLLLFAVTKRGWTDVHTAAAIGAILLAVTHLMVVKVGLVADVRLLATGRRGNRGHGDVR